MAKQLGKYEIIRTLGQGAMGEVYLAHHPAIGREVAIKTILPSAARGEDAEDRFRREATAAGKLNHPNLVTIYDFDKDGDVLYLVMEFVKGDDLDELIQQRALNQSQFLEVLAQICDGLSFAHRNGIVHRDIKPTNVRVIRDGKRILAKVMDFGIARVEDSGMTATGIVMGTVSYMAPEYIQSGKATAQCDLWAVGVMLYECLAGRKPFSADNTTTILFKIVTEQHPPLEAGVIQGVSSSIHAVLAKALDKDPAQRFQSADDFAKALRACKDPTWTGSIDDAMSKVFDRQQALTGAQPVGDDGTVQLTPSQAVALPASPTPPPAAATAVAATLPDSDDLTLVMAPPSAAPAKGGSRMGLYLAAGLGLLIIGGSAYVTLGRKGHQEAPATPAQMPAEPSGAAPSSQAAAPPPAPAPTPAVPVAPASTHQAAPVANPGVKTEPVKPEPAKVEPPKPVEETPAQKLDKAVALLATSPAQAATQLRSLAVAQPTNAQVQANYLAALYRSHNAGEFDRAFDSARAAGVTMGQMLSVPLFKDSIREESKLQRASSPGKVLTVDTMKKITAALQ